MTLTQGEKYTATLEVPEAFALTVWTSVPARMRIKRNVALTKIKIAVYDICSPDEREEQDWRRAVDYLCHRLRQYAASPEGKGPYHASLIQWLEDGRWADDDEAWRSRIPAGEVKADEIRESADRHAKENMAKLAEQRAMVPERPKETYAEHRERLAKESADGV